MKHSTILFISISFLVLSSCTISKDLEYKGFDNFVVSGGLDDPKINFDLSLYNPNPIRAKLKEMDLTISINQTEVGTAGIEDPVKMKALEVIVFPIVLETSKEQLGGLVKPGLESLLFDKPLAVQIAGNVTIRKFIFKRTFDFVYTDELKISDLKMH